MEVATITDEILLVELADTLPGGRSFAGMPDFDHAIQCINQGSRLQDKVAKTEHDRRAIELFKSAIQRGLDPLRKGYSHASIGELLLEIDDLVGAVQQFALVFPISISNSYQSVAFGPYAASTFFSQVALWCRFLEPPFRKTCL